MSDSESDTSIDGYKKSAKLRDLENKIDLLENGEPPIRELKIKITRKKVTDYCQQNNLQLNNFRSMIGATQQMFSKFMTYAYDEGPKNPRYPLSYKNNDAYAQTCIFFGRKEVEVKVLSLKQKAVEQKAKDKDKFLKNALKKKEKKQATEKKKAAKAEGSKKRKPQDQGEKEKNSKVVGTSTSD